MVKGKGRKMLEREEKVKVGREEQLDLFFFLRLLLPLRSTFCKVEMVIPSVWEKRGPCRDFSFPPSKIFACPLRPGWTLPRFRLSYRENSCTSKRDLSSPRSCRKRAGRWRSLSQAPFP